MVRWERGATDVVPRCNKLGDVCDRVPYGKAVDRYRSQTCIDESMVLVQNRRREQRNLLSLRPRRSSSSPATEIRRLSTHRIRVTRYVKGVPLVMSEMVEKHGEKNGNVFGCKFRGVSWRGEPPTRL
jgi:hypothetical protein